MSFSFRKFEFEATDVMIIITPLLATLFLILVLALHNEPLTTKSSFNNEQFIVMPRNCYLKSP